MMERLWNQCKGNRWGGGRKRKETSGTISLSKLIKIYNWLLINQLGFFNEQGLYWVSDKFLSVKFSHSFDLYIKQTGEGRALDYITFFFGGVGSSTFWIQHLRNVSALSTTSFPPLLSINLQSYLNGKFSEVSFSSFLELQQKNNNNKICRPHTH